MVTIKNYRQDVNGGGEDLLSEFPKDLEEAFSHLIKTDLGWGAKLTGFQGTSMETVARVLTKIDRTVYEGDEEDIRILASVAAKWEDLRSKVSLEEVGSELHVMTGGKPFFVTHLAQQVVNSKVAQEMLSHLQEG